MDFIFNVIVMFAVCVAYDLFVKTWLVPLVKSWFNKVTPPTPPTQG